MSALSRPAARRARRPAPWAAGAARAAIVLAAAVSVLSAACGSTAEATHSTPAPSLDGSTEASDDSSAHAPDGAQLEEGGLAPDVVADAGEASDGASDAGPAEGGLAADRFVTGVVSFTPGPCAGFGQSKMPGIVEGPPKGGGASQGSLDVVSLGVGGEIVLSFAPNAIVDGPGVDFIVFENPFDIGGNPDDPYAEPGEVSVSDDGTTWATYPCTATSYPYGECAGWHPVYSAPGNGISPVDPSTAGGDPFDLADVGLAEARFVRIRDVSGEVCPDAGGPTADGFDLDAISIVNAQMP
jgi:hypothetical protein